MKNVIKRCLYRMESLGGGMVKFGIGQAGFGNTLRCGTINFFDGWAASLDEGNPVKHVAFSVDWTPLGTLPIKKERPDLEKLFKKSLLGFAGVVDIPEDCLGKTLRVEAVLEDGAVFPMKEYPLEKRVTEEEKRYRAEHRLPDDMLIHLVVQNTNYRRFVEEGRAGVELILGLLKKHGIGLHTIGNVLDFGVGCARVFRWWKEVPGAEALNFYGTDINPALIEWCAKNIGFGEFSLNSLRPPTLFRDSQFDLVYAFSVFTHLTCETQEEWLVEFSRTLAPGKHLLVSVHGDLQAKNLPPSAREKYEKMGYLVLSKNVEGENTCSSYQSRGFSTTLFSTHFELLDCLPGALTCCGNQDLYLLRNRKARD